MSTSDIPLLGETKLGRREGKLDLDYRGSVSPLQVSELDPAPQGRIRDAFLYVTGTYSAIFFLLTLTFPQYFYFAPNLMDSDVRPTLLVLYIVTWPIAIIVPMILLWFKNISSWKTAMSSTYLVAVLGWPLVTIMIKIRAAITTGDAGMGYWGDYPVFILLEIVWPVVAVAVWAEQRKSVSVKAAIKREMAVAMRAEIKRRSGKLS